MEEVPSSTTLRDASAPQDERNKIINPSRRFAPQGERKKKKNGKKEERNKMNLGSGDLTFIN
jgi:hypothetical protein